MPKALRNAVAWVTLAQVLLVGALGTGLHGLLGCEHGPLGCADSRCCSLDCCTVPSAKNANANVTQCHDCVFCKHRRSSEGKVTPDSDSLIIACSDGAVGCDGCAVCDLLAQYHSATPFVLAPLSLELLAGDVTIQLHNAVVSAATRLALSRGPPTV